MADIVIHEEMPGLYRVYGRRPATCDGQAELMEWLRMELGFTAIYPLAGRNFTTVEEAERAHAAAQKP